MIRQAKGRGPMEFYRKKKKKTWKKEERQPQSKKAVDAEKIIRP